MNGECMPALNSRNDSDNTMPQSNRYVILEHDWNGIHYDLMLEDDGALKSWRLAKSLQPGEQKATRLPDHRLVYLQYEGPVSGDRGTVRRVSAGTYATAIKNDERWEVLLEGDYRGRLVFTPGFGLDGLDLQLME